MGVATILLRNNSCNLGRIKMTNYVYGAVTMVMLTTMVQMIDSNIPNSVWYYVGLVLPF